jgi:hypothetical protein
MKLNLDSVRDSVYNFFENHFHKISADTCEWLAAILIHCATIPSLISLMTGLSDKTPNIDIVLFAWAGLVMLFIRSIILGNSLQIVTIGIGFIIQASLMAFILFR